MACTTIGQGFGLPGLHGFKSGPERCEVARERLEGVAFGCIAAAVRFGNADEQDAAADG